LILSTQGHDLRGAEKNLQLYHQLSGEQAEQVNLQQYIFKLIIIIQK
jgi:hypothetical protein